MAFKSWTLTNVDTAEYVDEIAIDQAIAGTAQPFSIQKRRRSGGLSDGVDEIRVDNGAFTFIVIPTRGMGIWKAKHGEMNLGWQSPVKGPVHPAFVPLAEPSGLGFLDGFDELICRCGLESNGAPDFDKETGQLKYGLHGRIANRPAHLVDVAVDPEAGELRIVGIVDETRFHFNKLRMTSTILTRLGEPGFRLRDEIQNLSASEAEMQILYHVNLGTPLLDAGSQLVAPVKTVVPRNEHAASGLENWTSFSAEQAGAEEQVYFAALQAAADNRTAVMLKNGHGTAGVALRYDNTKLPCFSLWKNTTAVADGYVAGLEPAVNFPNPRSYEATQGRVVKLPPGARYTFELDFISLDTAAAVDRMQQEIESLQVDPPLVIPTPRAGWTLIEEA